MTASEHTPLRPALFLDRDGTIIEDRGFIGDPDQVVFLTGAIDALRALQPRFALFIVTNQGGIAAGAITAAQVAAVNQRLVDRLREAGVSIERVFVCPHSREDNCACIKPKPYFLQIAAREHGIDLGRSCTIGDHPYDVELGRAVGATGVFVLTGHGPGHVDELPPGTLILPSLAEAPGVIEAHQAQSSCSATRSAP
jgi:D-glycero-D-manno-heptose 1,7-bisphosphate phosphatase